MKSFNATIKFTFDEKHGTPEAFLRKALTCALDSRCGEHVEKVEVKQARSFSRTTNKYVFPKKDANA